MRTVAHFAACIASGIMLALAYPRAGIWPFAWVALVPWLVVVFTARWQVALIGSWIAGFAFFGTLMYWIAIFGYLPWALLALIEALAFVATAAVARFVFPLSRTAAASHSATRPSPATPSAWRILLVGFTWVTWEYLRGLGAFGVPWGQVGHSQAPLLPLAQLAAFGGVPAISFVVLIFNAALAHLIATRRDNVRSLAPVVWPAVLLVVSLALGAAQAYRVERSLRLDRRPAVRVAIAQASLKSWLTVDQLNVPLTPEQQDVELNAYAELTRDAAARGAQVVVWPESAVPGYINCEGQVRERVASLAREFRIWLIVGGPAFETGAGRPLSGLEYNSAYVISPRGDVADRYDKVHLVPFGEYVPWRSWLPLLSHYRVRETDVTRGAEHRALRAGGLALGPMICFESVFPYISRREALRGARALVIITNDAWFLRTAAAAQHLQIGRFRAIEEGLYVARGASTGISAFVDPLGRVTDSLGMMKRGVIISSIRPRRSDTLYSRIGPVFSFICAAAMAMWGLAALVERLRTRRATRQSSPAAMSGSG
jgi:apolipoprotein N-acyltransferase